MHNSILQSAKKWGSHEATVILDYLHRENCMVAGKLLNKQRLGNCFEID